jgi:uncharacterized protein YaiI (UPF0178 family)
MTSLNNVQICYTSILRWISPHKYCNKLANCSCSALKSASLDALFFISGKEKMQIWVDADACPNVIKEIIFRAANRTKTATVLVSNQPLRMPPSLYIKSRVVPAGFDVADNKIVELMEPLDLVITADIPLAAAVVEKGGTALNPRGEIYSENNIKERLSVRNFADGLRSSGVITGGPAKFGKREIQAFANSLDQFLTAR